MIRVSSNDHSHIHGSHGTELVHNRLHGGGHEHGHGHDSAHARDAKKESQTAVMDRSIFIAWKPEYEVGVFIIDEQHRGIVAAINSLYYATQHGTGGSMLPHVVGMVLEYANIHFRTEEELHAKCGFPADKEHRALHLRLSRETETVGKSSMENRDPQEFLHFMKEWWIDHICAADRAFKEHLAKMQ